MSSLREEQWRQLYASICDAGARYGQNNAFGEGDFWVMDDDYGGLEQKVILTRIGMLRTNLVYDLRKLLERKFRLWSIVVSIEDLTHPEFPPMGLVIRSDSVEDALVRSCLPPDLAGRDFNAELPN